MAHIVCTKCSNPADIVILTHKLAIGILSEHAVCAVHANEMLESNHYILDHLLHQHVINNRNNALARIPFDSELRRRRPQLFQQMGDLYELV